MLPTLGKIQTFNRASTRNVIGWFVKKTRSAGTYGGSIGKIFCLLVNLIPMVNKPACALPLDLSEPVQQTINLPHAGVERLVWSDDGNKIAALLPHGAYVADAHDGRSILDIWGRGNDDEGRLGIDSMFTFTADGEELIGALHTGGKKDVVWQQGAESKGAYLFSAVNVASGSSRYIFSDPIYKKFAGNGQIDRDGSLLIVQIGTSGFFGVYPADRPSQVTRYLGPILNKGNNALGAPKILYDDTRSTLVLLYIDGEIKVWDTAHDKSEISFSPSATGFSAVALDRSTGNLCTGGNGIIQGQGRDDPATLVRCWNLKTGDLVRAYSGTTSGVNSVAVSPNGHYIAAIDGGESFPLHLLLWDENASEPIAFYDYGRQSRVAAVAFSPDGGTLAVAVGNRIQLISLPRQSHP